MTYTVHDKANVKPALSLLNNRFTNKETQNPRPSVFYRLTPEVLEFTGQRSHR